MRVDHNSFLLTFRSIAIITTRVMLTGVSAPESVADGTLPGTAG